MSSSFSRRILDDGRLTDAQGRTVDFKHSVVIMTSNLGSHRIQEHSRRLEQAEVQAAQEAVAAQSS